MVQNQNTYIKDTSDFITKIEGMILPQNCILTSYDVTSMYTNMRFDELLGAVERHYNVTNIQGHINIPCPDVEDIIFFTARHPR